MLDMSYHSEDYTHYTVTWEEQKGEWKSKPKHTTHRFGHQSHLGESSRLSSDSILYGNAFRVYLMSSRIGTNTKSGRRNKQNEHYVKTKNMSTVVLKRKRLRQA